MTGLFQAFFQGWEQTNAFVPNAEPAPCSSCNGGVGEEILARTRGTGGKAVNNGRAGIIPLPNPANMLARVGCSRLSPSNNVQT
jgi:hypothetical protein